MERGSKGALKLVSSRIEAGFLFFFSSLFYVMPYIDVPKPVPIDSFQLDQAFLNRRPCSSQLVWMECLGLMAHILRWRSAYFSQENLEALKLCRLLLNFIRAALARAKTTPRMSLSTCNTFDCSCCHLLYHFFWILNVFQPQIVKRELEPSFDLGSNKGEQQNQCL